MIREKIVEVAKSYLGYKEGKNNDTIFGTWSGSPNQPWCASFVCYVLREAGIDKDIVPLFVSCTAGWNVFQKMNITQSRDYMPKAGDIIFIDWDPSSNNGVDHVGLVEYVTDGVVHTIEGNHSDKVDRWTYPVGSQNIWGYAVPAYENGQASSEKIEETKHENENIDVFHDGKINCIFDIQEWLNNKYGFNLALDNIYGQDTKKKLVMALQTEFNVQFNAGLVVDGIFGNKTKNACINVREGAKGNITMLIQMMLFIKGYVLDIDGIFGSDTTNKVKQFQNDNALTTDGLVGKNTFEKLFV